MRNRPIPPPSRRGFMLLIVTLVLTALTLSGAALLTLMKTENEATSTRGRKELTHGVVRSAVVYLVGCVEQTEEEREKLGGLYDNGAYFCAKPLLTREEGGADTSRFTIISPKLEDANIDGIRYGLVDESTRLNLQAVLAWDKESPGAGRAALMKLPGMTAIAADSILDWIDPDEQARQNGAEARYYANANLPYSPRNATPVFLEELLLARGVTRAQLYGSDENFTYNAEKSGPDNSNADYGGSLLSTPTASRGGATQNAGAVPWTALLTVFSAEKDVDPRGEARVNLNVDDLNFLYRELEPRVGADVAKFIVLYRQYGPETNEQESASPASRRAAQRGGRRSGYVSNEARGGAGNAGTDATSAPPTVGVLAQAQIDGSVAATTTLKTPLDIVGARVVVGNVAYASPIRDARDATKLMTLLDYASTSESTTIVGRVNVNAAPRPVLAAIPGISTADVQRIVSERPDMSKALPSDYRHASWLYTKGLVSLDTMKRLYDKTTARGGVYRGQIVGFLDRSNEVERAEVVVDGTTEPPRQVFFKDLSTLGKGFSDATLLGGLTTSGADSGDFGVSALDWREASGVVELERDGSGYLGANDDPFASIDALEASASLGGLNNPTDESTGINADNQGMAFPSIDGTIPNALDAGDFGTSSTDSNVGGAALSTPSFDASATEPSAAENTNGGTQSRRDRLLDALRTSRESRQTRNRGLSGAETTPEPSAATPENEPTVSESTPPVAAGGATTNRRAARTNDVDETPPSESARDRTQNALDALRRTRGGGARGGGRGGAEED